MLPPWPAAALLLDVDGTLLDFAPTPDSVVVPPELPPVLLRLREALGDALAVISGRPVAQIDVLLQGVPYAVAGEHGGAVRHGPSEALERPDLPELPAGWIERAEALAVRHPGAQVERKERGFVLHYRQAPEAGPALQAAVQALIAPDERFQMLVTAMAWEVRPVGMDKGVAVQRIMARAPFSGRQPIYIGDDVTDEDGIRAARAMGGAGLLVGDAFGGPAQVRDWLRRSAEQGRWADF
jgi:trehalose 6-phosphate phosphatase